jgi:hypothetical protein
MIERKGQIIAGGGFQLISNDGRFKYLLAPYTIFNEGSTAKSFLARCFVRDGEQWQPTTEQRTYTSPSIFIQDLRRSEGNVFSAALTNLKEHEEI